VRVRRRTAGSFQTGVAIAVGVLVAIPLLAGAAADGLMASVGIGGSTGVASAVSSEPVPAASDPLPPGASDLSWPRGQCTWYVAQHRHVTWRGDAADWLSNAAAEGMPTGSTPSVGAIVVYKRGWPYDAADGHVALVIAVTAQTYGVAEMNYLALGQIDVRTIPWPDSHVQGFIE